MSTATLPASQPKPLAISFTPLGEKKEITLTIDRVRQYLCVPTRSGVMPTNEQVVQYMMLCQAQSLNPWVRDAYLVGYDGKDGAQFSLITSHQAILKRAESSEHHDGLESGVVVKIGDTITERPGKIVYEGEKLIGGWCRVHRKDRSIPAYDAIQFSTYNTGRSRWAADPAGMIVKCAEAAALRKSYPSNLAALYCQEEMDSQSTPETAVIHVQPTKSLTRVEQVKQQRPAPEPVKPSEPAEESPAEPDPIGEYMETDYAVPVEKINQVRKAVRLAWPKSTDAERLALYKSWGIDDPANDESFDLYGIETALKAVEEQNEATRQ